MLLCSMDLEGMCFSIAIHLVISAEPVYGVGAWVFPLTTHTHPS